MENSFLISVLLRMAWPVWKTHKGNVPATALRNLEIDGDWPRGLANEVMRRITKDTELRHDLEECS